MSASTSSHPGPDEPGTGDDHAWISALADGDHEALDRAATLWRHDAGARERWHLYHLIGDVMRSDELAASPARDAEFLVHLRVRLANEPVPLAPSTADSAASPARSGLQRLGWRAPAAVAAGVATVAAALVLMRPAEGPPAVSVVSAPPAPSEGVIRDARLDDFIRAHEEARGVAPAALPGGGLRKAEIVIVPIPASPFVAASR